MTGSSSSTEPELRPVYVVFQPGDELAELVLERFLCGCEPHSRYVRVFEALSEYGTAEGVVVRKGTREAPTKTVRVRVMNCPPTGEGQAGEGQGANHPDWLVYTIEQGLGNFSLRPPSKGRPGKLTLFPRLRCSPLRVVREAVNVLTAAVVEYAGGAPETKK